MCPASAGVGHETPAWCPTPLNVYESEGSQGAPYYCRRKNTFHFEASFSSVWAALQERGTSHMQSGNLPQESRAVQVHMCTSNLSGASKV